MNISDSSAPTIPPLVSGGVMLTYRCSNSCRHCLYRCSPRQPDDWMQLSLADRVFDTLTGESHLQDIHLAGGEATLRMALLEEVIRLAKTKRVPLSYLETNAVWCVDSKRTRDGFERLAAAGLPAVLVSASMFHAEFIPFERTRRAVEIARQVFGPQGVIVWVPPLYEALSQLPADRKLSLETFCEAAGLSDRMEVLPDLYYLTPGGRVIDALRECYRPEPAESFKDAACRKELLNTRNFHIDPNGYLFTGLCPGIAAATIEQLHPKITRENAPITWTLMKYGPFGLLELAREACGLEPDQHTYISKCDLCYRVRKHLHATGHYPELRPANYYHDVIGSSSASGV